MNLVPNYERDTMQPLPETAGSNAPAPTKEPKKMATAKKKTAKAKKAAAPVDRSKAVAKTWKDPAVATARATHNGVRVGKETYRSVLAAFTELKLPIGRHIPFRAKLKAQGIGGSLDFVVVDSKTGKEVKTKFTLVELPRVAKAPAAKKKVAAPKASGKPAAKKAAAPRKRTPKTAPVEIPVPSAPEGAEQAAAV